jgi:hypothetical protein
MQRTARIEILAKHIHPRDGEKEFCILEACMDESGIHEGAHVCVIAGYWGSVKKWIRFESRWQEIILNANEPSLKEFHSVDFWYANGERKGVFAKWSDQKATQFIDDLASCIVDSKLFPTSAVLVTSEWKKLNKQERMFLTGGYYSPIRNEWLTHGAPNKLYFFPFQLAIANPAFGCPPGLHVHYFFDLNKQFRNHALNLYALLKADTRIRCRHQLGGIDFESSHDLLGLQAADLFAYQTYKNAKIRIESKGPVQPYELPPLLRKLVTNARSDQDFPFLGAESLNIALQSLPAHMRGPQWHPVKTEMR